MKCNIYDENSGLDITYKARHLCSGWPVCFAEASQLFEGRRSLSQSNIIATDRAK